MISYVARIAIRMFTKLFPSQKPTVYIGEHTRLKLASLLVSSGHKRPLLVTDKFMRESGLIDSVVNHLEDNGCDVFIFDGIVPNPVIAMANAGIEVGLKNNCDSIFIIGGGSAIDTAKIIAAGCTNLGGAKKLVGLLKVKQMPLPMYAVPTTSGTGSEVTNAAVISDDKTHKKMFVVDPKIIPVAAALDSDIIKSLPAHITAQTGMDALTHAIEAYTSKNTFPDVIRDAEVAIKLIFEYLPRAFKDGNDLLARENLAQASFLAGYAFTKSGLGYVHAISHQLSGHYNTPHGLANAIVLPRVLRFNKEVCLEQLARLEFLISGESKSKDALANLFIKRVDRLSREIDIPLKLDDLKQEDFKKITSDALKEALFTYPVPKVMKSRECRSILASVLSGDLK